MEGQEMEGQEMEGQEMDGQEMEESKDYKYLYLRSLLTKDLNTYILTYRTNLINIINDFNDLLNNNIDIKDIQERGIFLEQPTEINVETQIENLFHLFEDRQII